MPAVPDQSPADTPAPVLPLNERGEATDTSPTTSPTSPPEPLQPITPPIDLVLVAPEQTGDVVAPAGLKLGSKYLSVPVVIPTAPGRYRLTITLHDGDGVAYDAATQAVVPALAVRVTGDVDGAILVAPTATLTAGTDAELPLRVVNLGKVPWGHGAVIDTRSRFDIDEAVAATLVGRWLSLSDDTTTPVPANARVDLPAGLEPRVTVDATLELSVPERPGDYLLVLDVLTPEHGSLTAAGVEPTIVRVTVVP